MDPEFTSPSRKDKSTDREKVRLNKRLFIYLFFLVISIIFWYLNALGKNYIAQVNYSVHYKNFPKGKVLVSDLPVQISIRVHGIGFQILRYKILSFFKPIDIDLNEFQPNIHFDINKSDYYLVTKNMQTKMNSLFSEFQLIGIKPDTLHFSFTDVVDKKILIKPSINLEFEKQYMLNGPLKVIPDCIVVSGPEAVIDTLAYLTTKNITIEHVKDTIVSTLELAPIKNFIFPVNKVKVLITTEKFTEITLNVPIETYNVPDGLDLKVFPSSITVSGMVSVSNYDKITPFLFKATVDYNSINDEKLSKLKVNLVKSPSVVSNVKIYPKSVEYIIEK